MLDPLISQTWVSMHSVARLDQLLVATVEAVVKLELCRTHISKHVAGSVVSWHASQ